MNRVEVQVIIDSDSTTTRKVEEILMLNAADCSKAFSLGWRQGENSGRESAYYND